MVLSQIYSNQKDELTKFNHQKLYKPNVLPQSLTPKNIYLMINSDGWSVTQQKTRFPILHIPIVLVMGGIRVSLPTKGSNRATFPQVSLYCLYSTHPTNHHTGFIHITYRYNTNTNFSHFSLSTRQLNQFHSLALADDEDASHG